MNKKNYFDFLELLLKGYMIFSLYSPKNDVELFISVIEFLLFSIRLYVYREHPLE